MELRSKTTFLEPCLDSVLMYLNSYFQITNYMTCKIAAPGSGNLEHDILIEKETRYAAVYQKRKCIRAIIIDLSHLQLSYDFFCLISRFAYRVLSTNKYSFHIITF